MILYACALAIGAGVAYGYDYCLAEYATLARSDVQMEMEKVYKPEDLIRRSGNLISQGNEVLERDWTVETPQPAKEKPLPILWLYEPPAQDEKLHSKTTPHLKEPTRTTLKENMDKEITQMNVDVTKTEEVTETAKNLTSAELKPHPMLWVHGLPTHYKKLHSKTTPHLKAPTRTTLKENMDKEITQMNVEVAKTEEVTETAKKLTPAELKPHPMLWMQGLPTHYKKLHSKITPHLKAPTRTTVKVEMDKQKTEMNKEVTTTEKVKDSTPAEVNTPRPILWVYGLPAQYEKLHSKTTLGLKAPTRTTVNVQMEKEITHMKEEVTETEKNSTPEEVNSSPTKVYTAPPARSFKHFLHFLRTTEKEEMKKKVIQADEKLVQPVVNLSAYSSSLKPYIITKISTNNSPSSDTMRRFTSQSNHEKVRPTKPNNFFFYKTSKTSQRRKTEDDSEYSEMEIRVFNRPSYGKYEGLPMRHWYSVTKAPEPHSSEDDYDYKNFLYF